MAEAVIRILKVDEAAAVDALKQIDGAMNRIQATAQRTGKMTAQMIPVKPIQQGEAALVSVGGPLGLVAGGMGAAGIQSSALGVGMQAAALSSEVLKGGTVKLGAAMKGLMASIGPIGWVLIAVTAAAVALGAVWKSLTNSTERQKEALEDLAEAERKHHAQMRKFAIEKMKLLGQTTKASLAAAKEEMKAATAVEEKTYKEDKAKYEAVIKGAWYGRASLAERKIALTRLEKLEYSHFNNLWKITENGELKIAKIKDEARDKEIREKEDAASAELAWSREFARKAADELQQDRTDMLAEAQAAVNAEEEAASQKARIRDRDRADWAKATAEDKKADEDRVRDAATLARRALVNQKDDNADLIKELKKKQAAIKAADPAFQAQFVGLADIGRQMQAAAASREEEPKSIKLQERIKALQEKNEGIQLTIRDNSKKTVLALETIADKFKPGFSTP